MILSRFIGSRVAYRTMRVLSARVRLRVRKESGIQTGLGSKVVTDFMSSSTLQTTMFFMPKVRRASSIESICATEKSGTCDRSHQRDRNDIAFIGTHH